MRRSRQALPIDECVKILETATSGVLCLNGADGYPYGVPLSYIYADNALIFHCGPVGYKMDCVAGSDKASFTVIAQDDIKPELVTTFFRSVIVYGTIKIVEDESKAQKLFMLGNKYAVLPEHKNAVEAELNKHLKHTTVLELAVERITGKQAIELCP